MKSPGMVFLWLAASVVAVGVAWTGVGIVSHELDDPPSVQLVRTRDAADAAPTTVDVSDQGERSAADAVVEPRGDGSTGSSAEDDDNRNDAASGSTEGSSVAGAGGTSGASPSTSTAPPSTTSAPPTTAAPRTITYSLVGGTTAITFSPDGVSVAWATPRAGFDVRVESHGDDARVEFRSETHWSRIDAGWEGAPAVVVSEQPHSSDEDSDSDSDSEEPDIDGEGHLDEPDDHTDHE
jgi:hypothetical protein